MQDDATLLRLERWTGTWADDDPDAAFKAQVRDYTRLDPMETLHGMAEYLGIPEGAIARYVLAKWAAAGSDGLLEIGPSMVEQLWGVVAAAEDAGTDEARLTAYGKLRGMLSWLRAPLTD